MGKRKGREMQNLYPLFERNRILKKELLWSLRDYSFSHVQLEYQEHGEGILRGCMIKVKGDQLVVGPGIIKYGQFICLMMEEERIYYKPCEQVQYLKVSIEIDRTSVDFIKYQIGLYLDFNEPRNENEFELCRFNLRSGAVLRDQYKNFFDMETQYDTINLIHADWAALGGKALSPSITRYFAENVLMSENSKPEDCSFAYLCLSQAGAVPSAVLSRYVSKRIGCQPETVAKNQEIYEAMCGLIKMIQHGEEKRGVGVKEKHRILVD